MTERNHEQDVLDAIAELVDESLAHGPTDDYHRDYLARSTGHGNVAPEVCPLCFHEFHGLRSTYGCPGEFGTEAEIAAWRDNVRVSGTAASPRYTIPNGPPYVPGVDMVLGGQQPRWRSEAQQVAQFISDELGGPQSGGYTIADLERMRWSQPPQYPPSYRSPRVRFWATNPETGELQMLEGTLEISEMTYSNDGMTVSAQVREPIQHLIVDPARAFEMDAEPAGTIPDGLISMEALTVGEENIGFEQIGTIAPDALEITHDVDYQRTWGGRTIRTAERYGASIEFDECHVNSDFFNRLIRGGQ